MAPQNMLLWHKDYFELKALEKQQVQEEYSDLPFSSWKQEIKPLHDSCPATTRGKEIFLSPETGSQRRENSISRPRWEHSYLLLAPPPHAPYISVIFPQLLFFVQPGINAFRFWHFFGSSFSLENFHVYVVFAFLLLMCLMAVSCSGPARDPRRAEEKLYLPSSSKVTS